MCAGGADCDVVELAAGFPVVVVAVLTDAVENKSLSVQAIGQGLLIEAIGRDGTAGILMRR